MRGSLLLLVGLCVAPLTIAGVALLYQNYRLQREVMETRTQLVARQVAADVQRELSSLEGGLRVLAASKDLQSGNFKSFYALAQSSVNTGIHYSVVLSDNHGAQILNTFRPWGSALPATGNPPELTDILVNRRTVLTNVFDGPVTHKPTVAMALPVFVHDAATYSLAAGISPQKLSALLAAQNVPEDWIIAVLDASGVIAARSRDADHFVGQATTPSLREAVASRSEGTLSAMTKDGIPALTAFTRFNQWGWTVAVGAPRSALQAAQSDALLRLVLGISAAVLLGLAIAAWVGRNVIRSVKDLNRAALQSAQGLEIQMPRMLLKEADAVGDAILRAANTLREVKYLAHHDPLTGLANRTLFFEMTAKQAAIAARHGSGFAMVALDLDGFKLVNDHHGHDAGDAVLKEAARRIEKSIRSGDVAARLGGDEFMVLLNHADSDYLPLATGRIVQALSQPYAGVKVAVSASAGVSCFPLDGQDVGALMKSADNALYSAKNQGKNRAVFAQQLKSAT